MRKRELEDPRRTSAMYLSRCVFQVVNALFRFFCCSGSRSDDGLKSRCSSLARINRPNLTWLQGMMIVDKKAPAIVYSHRLDHDITYSEVHLPDCLPRAIVPITWSASRYRATQRRWCGDLPVQKRYAIQLERGKLASEVWLAAEILSAAVARQKRE